MLSASLNKTFHSFLIYLFQFHHIHFHQAAVSRKISNLLICFCSLNLSCPILEKDNFIENMYIECIVLLNSVLL